MLPQGGRVTCYPGQSKAKESKAEASKSKGKQKQSKSNCDATRGTCYPRARVSHVTLGRACHMLPRGKQSKRKQSMGKESKAKQSKSKANQTVTPRVSHVTPGRACHMLPWGARVTCYPGQSKAKGSKAEASKAKGSRSKANQTVTPRVSLVTRGRACHMLPSGARVTCYPGESKAKESKAWARQAKPSKAKARQIKR